MPDISEFEVNSLKDVYLHPCQKYEDHYRIKSAELPMRIASFRSLSLLDDPNIEEEIRLNTL